MAYAPAAAYTDDPGATGGNGLRSADPENPTPAETAAIKKQIELYQGIFQAH